MRTRFLLGLSLAGLVAAGLFSASFIYSYRTRAVTRQRLLHACHDVYSDVVLSRIDAAYVEPPEIVLAAMGIPRCVAYVRFIRSRAVDRDLSAARQALAVDAIRSDLSDLSDVSDIERDLSDIESDLSSIEKDLSRIESDMIGLQH